jgi:deoxycytidine triphosphate deaminase
MILKDREIQVFINTKQITVNPIPSPDAYSSTSLDLTLDEPGEIWKALPGQPIRPGAPGYKYGQLEARKTKVSL